MAKRTILFAVCAIFLVALVNATATVPPDVSIATVWKTRYYRVRYYEDPTRKVLQSSNLMQVHDNFWSGERVVEMTGITDDQYWFDGHRDNFTMQVEIAFNRMFNQFEYSGTPFTYCSWIVTTLPGLLNHSSEPLPPFVNNKQPGNIYQTNYTTLRGQLINNRYPGIGHYPTSVLHGAASANQYVLINIKPHAQGPVPADQMAEYCTGDIAPAGILGPSPQSNPLCVEFRRNNGRK